jgi:transcriptional regulator with PAS, ATPase and Fis domain
MKPNLIGISRNIQEVKNLVQQVADTGFNTLVCGETGVGKELVAQSLYLQSGRKGKPFIKVNCAALPDTLLESELFGHRAGAFTDARRDKAGRFTLAHKGTIFLDEIGDISPAMQIRLLRVLQDGLIEPLGAEQPVPIDVRVVAATNKSLSDLVQKGVFRGDLYYRIRVIQLKLPDLRHRREDIPLLIEHLLERFNRLQEKNITGVSAAVMARLMEHPYPGNVRELENIIEQAFVLCRGMTIELHHLPPELRSAAADTKSLNNMSLGGMERVMITEALRRHNGNRKAAARDLGIDPSTLYRKIKGLNIRVPETDGRSRKT